MGLNQMDLAYCNHAFAFVIRQKGSVEQLAPHTNTSVVLSSQFVDISPCPVPQGGVKS
jgi:hypothetical protein